MNNILYINFGHIHHKCPTSVMMQASENLDEESYFNLENAMEG